jgi:NAD(P)-dependent dehydrogenase (short-subunit alcohol dehydrogenase family)
MKVLITGGASGIGKEISKYLATRTDGLIIATYRGSVEEATELAGQYSNIRLVKCDFKEQADMEALVNLIETEQIDVLINNAYTGMHKEHFQKMPATAFVSGFLDNIVPVIEITQAAIGVFRKKKSGKIITLLSSAIVNKPPIGWSAYVAEKNYLYSLAKSWATENARFNVTSNMISPAFVETAFNKDVDERVLENMRNDLPLKRFLSGAEVAEAVYFLVGCSQQINGHNIIINQGTDIL